MEKKNLDWANLGFGYMTTDYRYVANYKNGAWDKGGLTDDPTVTLNECAGIFHYCQEIFEGLKAYTTEDGHIVTFRPDLNAVRMMDSAKRLEMPPFPAERFLEAVEEVVKANAAWVPPYGSGASLYVRPYMFASSPVIGVKPADEYQFRILVTPVGPYFKGGVHPLTICVSDFDRANMFLDPATRTYVEETGGANFIFIDKEGTLVFPKSDSILPSVTRRSIAVVAKDILGMKVEERPVKLAELSDFAECGVCGTAAVVCPVGKVVDHGREICFPSGMENMGPVIQKLYDTLTGIQMGKIEGPAGWVHKIM